MAEIYKRVFSRPFLFQSNSNSNSRGYDTLASNIQPVQLASNKSSSRVYEFVDNLQDLDNELENMPIETIRS